MTTICVINNKKERAIYGDRRVTEGYSIVSENDIKVHKVDTISGPILVGFCGNADAEQDFLSLLSQGMESLFKYEDFGLIAVLRKTGPMEIYTGKGSFKINEPVYCMGSGGSYALSAIKLGLDPIKAIKHASKLDAATNSRILKVSL